MLALANKQYHNGAYDAAMETYRSFQKRYPKHDMALAAELGLALCREANGAITEALTDFRRLLTAHQNIIWRHRRSSAKPAVWNIRVTSLVRARFVKLHSGK